MNKKRNFRKTTAGKMVNFQWTSAECQSKDVSECIWLPRYDQLEELCIEFFIYNMSMSSFEARLRFLEWYSGCLKEAFEQSLMNPDYGFVDSSGELLLNEAMIMMHGKKLDGEKWLRVSKVIRAAIRSVWDSRSLNRCFHDK